MPADRAGATLTSRRVAEEALALRRRTGKRSSVLIDLEEPGDAWNDFAEGLIAESHKDNEKLAWDELDTEPPGDRRRGGLPTPGRQGRLR
ncbi:hypothetical protein HN371_04080 [Candidatus Poribacteria bacterium]|nr:hypothetical protein [Candidatus Poribacteria bacterium]MBT5536690.1 hypothetical protein [Candidatus Poribacteria bacterium]MBT5710552.1 hypothetical protein [Candidatus Poribacteria bacterium]MBT7100842.1 hypothetical protein [Candidatus Poribacteria bacterium]MBT7805186.1 hypothetical protein [Candidatus Poribacteria bacterium]